MSFEPARPTSAAATESPPERLVWDDATVTRFWRYYADRPDTYFSTAFGAVISRRIARHLPAGGRVLDYGSGPGGLVRPLLAAGFQVGALEYNLPVAERLRAELQSARKFLGVWTTAGLERDAALAGSFDAVFLIEVIEHLSDPLLVETLMNIKRLLRPGGRLVCTTPNDEDLERAMVFCPASGKIFHPMQHVRSWTADTLAARLGAAGFSPKRVYSTDFGADLRSFPRQWAVRVAKQLARFPRKDPHLVAIVEA